MNLPLFAGSAHAPSLRLVGRRMQPSSAPQLKRVRLSSFGTCVVTCAARCHRPTSGRLPQVEHGALGAKSYRGRCWSTIGALPPWRGCSPARQTTDRKLRLIAVRKRSAGRHGNGEKPSSKLQDGQFHQCSSTQPVERQIFPLKTRVKHVEVERPMEFLTEDPIYSNGLRGLLIQAR